MNNIEEAKKFILNKMNECFLCTNDIFPNSIFYIWNNQYLRIKKLLRLCNKLNEIEFKPNINSIIMFHKDYNHKDFWYSDTIYLILKKKYYLNEQQIIELFIDIFKYDNNQMILNPKGRILKSPKLFKEDNYKWRKIKNPN